MQHKRVLWSFLDFELDPSVDTLWRAGSRVDIDAKPLALLSELIRHRQRVVSREELRRSVWRGVSVSDAAIASAVRDLRRSLGDSGSGQSLVRTVRNKGFRFVAPIEERESSARVDPILGRDDILERMEVALQEVGPAGGRWLWVAGEPGIGKTRTLVELATRLRRRGIDVCFGSCLEEPGAAPYRPWQQIVRRLVGGNSSQAIADRHGPLAAEALRLLPESDRREPALSSSATDWDERLRLFDAVAELLRGVAERGPLALAVDDLHRADAPTAKLLRHLLDELPRLPLLVVAAFRPREVGAAHPIAPALANSQPGVERLLVRGLEADEVQRLAGSLLGRSLSSAEGRALHRRTEGNPLYVREIAHALGELGGSSPGDLRRIEEQVPTGITQLLQGRLGRLPDAVAKVLECAAAIGRTFEVDILGEVLREEGIPASMPDALDAAFAAGLVEPVADVPGRLHFTHILVRDGVYALIPPLRRAALHGRVGRALECLRDADVDVTAHLAHHFGQALGEGDADRAFLYTRRAGEHALSCAAWEEAERFFDLALRALDLGDPTDTSTARAACLVGLGRARWRRGAPAAAREAFARAATLAGEAGDADALADAALGYAGRTDAEPRANPVSTELLEQALAALPDGDSARRCEVLSRLGTELYYADSERCDALTQRAVAMAERLGERDALAYALSARGFALMRPDVEPARRVALSERLESVLDDAGEVAALGLQEKMIALLEQGDALRFEESLRAFRRLAAELRQPFFRWMARVFEGTRLFLSGRIEDALDYAEAAFALGRDSGTPNALPMFSAQLLYLRREQGRMGELEPALREMLEGDSAYPAFRSALPPMLLELDREHEARLLFEQILARNLDDVARDQHWVPMLAMLANACTQLRDAERAKQLYALLAPFSGRLVVVGHGGSCDGAVDHHLARLAAAADDMELADEHFAAGVDLERRAGARLYAAHSQRHWARVLWKSGAPHERERARELAAEATATYRSLGLEARCRETALS